MPRRRKSRIYWRNQGGVPRAYGDFLDLGGRQEALIPKGEKRATSDPDVAQSLCDARVKELEGARRSRQLLGSRDGVTFAEFASSHLKTKRREKTVEPGTLRQEERYLDAAIEFFDSLTTSADGELGSDAGADRQLAEIGVAHVKAYRLWLGERKSARGKPTDAHASIATATQRKYLNSLGNLFAGAIEEELYEKANPVHALRNKPTGSEDEANWLEVWEAALLLESARTFPYHTPVERVADRLTSKVAQVFGEGSEGVARFAARMGQLGKLASTHERVRAYLQGDRIPAAGYLHAAAAVLGVDADWLRHGNGLAGPTRPDPVIYPWMATSLLTGARPGEVTGLEVNDVSFRRGVIDFRPNEWRNAKRVWGPRLKTKTSRRTVRIWPQLRPILEEYLDTRGADLNRLLFPSPRLLQREGREGIITDTSGALDAIAKRAGWDEKEVRPMIFRHTYISTRLQTTDHGAPIQPWTVAREVGHKTLDLVNEIYGHVQHVRYRSEVVEYRVEAFEELEDVRRRLRPLRVVA